MGSYNTPVTVVRDYYGIRIQDRIFKFSTITRWGKKLYDYRKVTDGFAWNFSGKVRFCPTWRWLDFGGDLVTIRIQDRIEGFFTIDR